MRTIAIILLVVGVLVVLSVIIYLLTGWISARGRQRARVKANTTPWESYSRYDPASDKWVIGVERVTDEGLVLNRVGMQEFSPDMGDSVEVNQAELEAMVRAATYNRNRTGI